MRVTNQLITRHSQSRLQSSLQGIDRLREDISSGLRVRKMSDDPIAAGEVVRIGSSMRAIAQFRRNIDIGLVRAQSEETALDQLSNSMTRGVELGISQASATANAQSRLMVKTEIDQLINQAVVGCVIDTHFARLANDRRLTEGQLELHVGIDALCVVRREQCLRGK